MPTPYTPEMDELRQEVRRGVVGELVYWPKSAGAGNVQPEASPAYTLHRPDGTQLASGTGAVAQVDAAYRIAVAVPGIDRLDEDYQARITWRVEGESIDRLEVVAFDVVLWPFGPSSVSLNDLLEERPEVGRTLERFGRLFTPTRTPQQMAAVYAHRARVELDAKIRAQVERDHQTNPKARRPHLILNRERLNRVERKIAMALIYAAECSNPEGDTESAGLLRYYRGETDAAWASLGPMKYDASQDLVVDTVEHNATRMIRMRRVQ